MRDGRKGEAFQVREQYEQSVRGTNNCRQFYRIKAKGAVGGPGYAEGGAGTEEKEEALRMLRPRVLH